MTTAAIMTSIHQHPYNLRAVIRDLGLETNLKLCLDAGDELSYRTGQVWTDRSTLANSFDRGADSGSASDDPTFNGTPNLHSSGEYFLYDGGDFFTMNVVNPSWVENIHKDNAIFTMLAFHYWHDATNVNVGLLETGQNFNEIGFNFAVSSTGGGAVIFQAHDGASPSSLSVTCTISGGMTDGWHMSAISLNEATGSDGGFGFHDGNYAQNGGEGDEFTSTYSGPSSSSATRRLQIGKRGGSNADANSRIAALAVWEGTKLTKANLDAIWTRMRGRWGI